MKKEGDHGANCAKLGSINGVYIFRSLREKKKHFLFFSKARRRM